MKRWMKGVLIAGVVLFLAGSAISVLALVGGKASWNGPDFRHWFDRGGWHHEVYLPDV